MKALFGLGILGLGVFLFYKGFTWLGGVIGIIGMIIGGAAGISILIALIIIVVKSFFTDSDW